MGPGGDPPARADVVVVGGGIVGAASAYQLARRGLEVVLLERGEIAGAQSGRNWGFVRTQGRAPAEIPLMLAARRLWPRLSEELGADVEWTQGGSLALAPDEATASRFRAWAALGVGLGVETKILEPGEIERLLPGVRREWPAAMHTPGDGHADPVETTQAFARAATRHGATILTRRRVDRMEARDGRVVQVVTEGGKIATEAAVCAAGASSRGLLATLGLDLPLQLARTTVAATESTSPLTQAAVWEPGRLAFRQTRSGEVIVAPGGLVDVDVTLALLSHLRWFTPLFWRSRNSIRLRLGAALLHDLRTRLGGRPAEHEPAPSMRDAEASLAALTSWFPELSGLGITRVWAGTIDGTPDFVPVISRSERVEGLVVAAGFSGHGFALGPIVGVVVAELVAGAPTEVDVTPFRLSRFSEGDFARPSVL